MSQLNVSFLYQLAATPPKTHVLSLSLPKQMFACSQSCLTYKKVFVVEVMLMFEDIMTDLLRCYKLGSRGVLLGVSTPGLITHVIGGTSLSEYVEHGGSYERRRR